MTQPEEILRNCLEDWTQDQQEFTAQLGESLDALDAYQEQLSLWQQDLETQAASIAEQRAQLDLQQQELLQQRDELQQQRQKFNDEQAVEISATAKLDQARAEIEDLRHQLDEMLEPLAVGTSPTMESPRSVMPGRGGAATAEAIDPTVSAVAKQFQKLREQQAARRTAAR